jgi:hypothetical protein
VYRGDHVVVWEPGDWWIVAETGTPRSDRFYVLGDINFPQEGGYNSVVLQSDASGVSIGLNVCPLPEPGETERKLLRGQLSAYTDSVLFTVADGYLKSKAGYYVTLGSDTTTDQQGSILNLDATQNPVNPYSNYNGEFRLSDSTRVYTIEYWTYYDRQFQRTYYHPAGFRQIPLPECRDWDGVFTPYYFERRRNYL